MIASDHLALQLVHHMDLVDMIVVSLFDKDYLIVETTDKILHKLTYFTFVGDQMRNVFESFHNASQNVVPVQFMERSCVGFYTEYVSNYLQLDCALFTQDGQLHMESMGSFEAPAKLVQVWIALLSLKAAKCQVFRFRWFRTRTPGTRKS